MDQKTWLWRKKSSEKTVVIKDKPDLTSKVNEAEVMDTQILFDRVVSFIVPKPLFLQHAILISFPSSFMLC